MPNAGMPNMVTEMPNVRGIARNAERLNAESMWCYGLYDEKFHLHVEARLTLYTRKLIPYPCRRQVRQCEESLHTLTTYDNDVTVVGFHY